ncbi:MAG TPA: hypothetical protein VGD13_11915 [Xanthobacteraceae bacterium]|jgi:hypothetical protein
MVPRLRLFEDTLPNAARLLLPEPLARMIYVVHGSVAINDASFADGGAWHGNGPAELVAGITGVTCWRFEFCRGAEPVRAPQPGVISHLKLSAALETLPAGELLMRGDSVAFPPGGCAFLHTHQGPGIRVLLDGGIRIDTHGRSTSYGPGGAWYETGPDPVFAQAAADRASRFVRVMILPRLLLGKSSIKYLREEDVAKPKVQQYKSFVDIPVEMPSS